jgi:hypothetical protein
LQKPENQDYFRGPQHVARVQAWRAVNPDYPRRPHRASATPLLQETRIVQALDASKKSFDLRLQEMKHRQAVEAAEVRGAWAGEALQDAM